MQQSRSELWQISAVCLLACSARVAMVCWQGDRLSQDIDAYLEIGRNIAAGVGFSLGQPPHVSAYRPVLLPLVLAAIFRCGASPIMLGLIHVILGTLAAGLTYRAGRLLQLGPASLAAAALVAVDPLLLQYTVLPMTEILCSTLISMWCWGIVEFPPGSTANGRRAWISPFLQGVCLGLICLCRPGFLATAGLILLWMGLQGMALTATLRQILWTLIGLGLTLAPWTVRNAVVIGKATPATTHGGYTLLLANNPTFYHEVILRGWGTVWQRQSLLDWQQELEVQLQAAGIEPRDEVARDTWMYRRAAAHIRNEPLLFLRAILWRAIRFWDLAPWTAGSHGRLVVWGTTLFYGAMLIAMMVGLYRLDRVEWRIWSLLLLLPATLWMTHWFYWTDMRMRAPVIPILALLAARAISRSVRSGPVKSEG